MTLSKKEATSRALSSSETKMYFKDLLGMPFLTTSENLSPVPLDKEGLQAAPD